MKYLLPFSLFIIILSAVSWGIPASPKYPVINDNTKECAYSNYVFSERNRSNGWKDPNPSWNMCIDLYNRSGREPVIIEGALHGCDYVLELEDNFEYFCNSTNYTFLDKYIDVGKDQNPLALDMVVVMWLLLIVIIFGIPAVILLIIIHKIYEHVERRNPKEDKIEKDLQEYRKKKK